MAISTEDVIVRLMYDGTKAAKEIDKTSKVVGNLGETAKDAADKLADAEKESNKLGDSAKKQAKTINELKDELKKLIKTGGDLKDNDVDQIKTNNLLIDGLKSRIKTAESLGRVKPPPIPKIPKIPPISLDVDAEPLDRVDRKVKEIGDSVEDTGKKTNRFGSIVKKASVFLVGLFAAKVSADLIKELGRLGTEIESIENKAAIVFGESLPLIQQAAKETANSLGLTTAEYLKQASSIADLLIPLGLQRQEAAEVSKEVLNLAGALSEWSNGTLTTTQTNEILTKALLGEREGLKQLGISISEADVSTRLAEKGMKGLTGEALQQAKALVSLELITQKSSDAQKSFAENTDTLSRSQARIGASFQEIQNNIATALIPAFERILKGIEPVIKSLSERLPSGIERLRQILSPFASSLDRLFSSFTNGASVTNALDSAFELLADTLQVTSNISSLLADGFSFVLESINSLTGSESSVVSFFDFINKGVTGLLALTNGLVAGVKAAFNNVFVSGQVFGARMALLKEQITGVFTDNDERIEAVRNATEKMKEQYVSISDAFNEAGREIVTRALDTQKEISDSVDKTTRKVTTNTKKQFATIPKELKEVETLIKGSVAFIEAEISKINTAISKSPQDETLLKPLLNDLTRLEDELRIAEERIRAIKNGGVRDIDLTTLEELPTLEIPIKPVIGEIDTKVNLPEETENNFFGINASDSEIQLIKDSANQIKSIASDLTSYLIQQEQQRIDAAIQKQQERIGILKDENSTATAEQITLEEDRLNQLNKQKEDSLKKQRSFAATEIAINNAVAVSAAIVGALNAFKEGNIVKGVATTIAGGAALIAATIAVKNALSSVPSFFLGTEDTGTGNGNHVSDNKGGFLSVLHPNERVVPKKYNQYLEGIKNSELPMLAAIHKNEMQTPRVSKDVIGFTESDKKDFKKMNSQLSDVKNLLEKNNKINQSQKVSFNITEKGISGSVKKYDNKKHRSSKRVR